MSYEMGKEMDSLNIAFAKAEEALRDLGLGVTGSVEMGLGARLVFRKTVNEWGLFISHADMHTPIRSASRELRIEASSKLQELYTQICKISEGELEKVRVARKNVERFVEDMKNGKPAL